MKVKGNDIWVFLFLSSDFFLLGFTQESEIKENAYWVFLHSCFYYQKFCFGAQLALSVFFFPAGEIKCQCSSTSMPGLLQKGVGRILKEVKGIFGLM